MPFFTPRLGRTHAQCADLFPIPSLPRPTTQNLLLAHNGAVEVDDPAAGRVVDSEWALAVIVKAGSIEKALPYLKDRTKANSALTCSYSPFHAIKRQHRWSICLNYHKARNLDREAYYKMYTAGL